MSDQRFLVTARKYRPQLFGELVAQEHVTGTLKNAIRLDRLAHAYLFTGPRGVGKTTAARILAKAINCTTPQSERADEAEPCRQCDSCRSFEEGRNLNIIEIDAASNNKVDDVRDLRETVRIPPQGNRKKVYIVDEVHMLTNQAFNALLKTLEEPPPHVLFIFATTEPHKVLPTIQSRCQRFDFRRIPVLEIVARLAEICQSESITADEGSLMLIARRGDGALRDALSVFDQAVSLCGTQLGEAQLVDALGVVSEELFFQVTDHVAQGNVGGMLQLVDHVVSGGYDLQEFLDGLAEHLRNVLVAATMPDTSLIEASEASRLRFAATAESLSETQILRLLSIIDRTLDGLRVARQPRLRLELALVRMASLPATTDIKAALDQLKAMGPAQPASAPQSSQPAPKPASSSAQPKPRPAPPVARTEPAPPASASTPAPEVHSAPVGAQSPETAGAAEPEPTATKPAPPPPDPDPVSEPPPTEPAEEQLAFESASPPAPPSHPRSTPPLAGPDQASLFGSGGGGMNVFGTPALRPPTEEHGPQSAVASETAEVATLPRPVGQVPEGWETVVESVMESKIHLGALLHHAQAELRNGSGLTLVVPDDFHARVLREATGDILEGLSTAGHPNVSHIEFEVDGQVRPEADIQSLDVDPKEALRKICEEYPAIRLLMERFGGEIVW